MDIRKNIRSRLRLVAVAGVLTAVLLCGRARAQVLDQVPDDALVVLKIRNLADVSRKAAKMAKSLGLDNINPDFGDPLGALEEKAHVSKGVDRSGELAIVYLDPAAAGGEAEQSYLALIPVGDFKAFIGNFKDTKVEGDVTQAKTDDGDEIFISEWGRYAAVTPAKEILSKKPKGGIKLQGPAAKESETKDALLYANMTTLRGKALPELKKNREQMVGELVKNLNENGGEGVKPYAGVLKTVVEGYLNIAEEFLKDARSATVGLSVTDDGIGATVMADFEPDSYIGALAAANRNTQGPLLAGLPLRKYFLFGGTVSDPKTNARLFHDLIGPIRAELEKVESAKPFLPALDSMEKAAATTTGATVGYLAPAGALGAESLMQEVAIIRGDDVTSLRDAQRQSLDSMNQLFRALPGQKEMSTQFVLKKDAKTVEGVTFDAYETKFTVGEDNPNGPQMKQMLEYLYGKGGQQTGLLGKVSDKSLLVLQDVPDKQAADLVAAAKKDEDVLSAQPGVATVAARLPKSRSLALYVDLNQILQTAVHDAQGAGLPVSVKLPQSLPPIGVTAGTEESTIRMDAFVPSPLLQALVSAYAQMEQGNKPPNGGL